VNTPVADADALEEFLQRVPKMELHCHLLGSVRRQTFTDFVRRASLKALSDRVQAPLSEADIEAFYTRGEKPVGTGPLAADHPG
jgi:adenosine deaminase